MVRAGAFSIGAFEQTRLPPPINFLHGRRSRGVPARAGFLAITARQQSNLAGSGKHFGGGRLLEARHHLAELSHFAGFAVAKPFRISEGYPRVFTTGKGGGDLF